MSYQNSGTETIDDLRKLCVTPLPFMKMTVEQTDYVNNLFAGSLGDLLQNLKARWDDEKEYEDFTDYADAMKKHIIDIDCERLTYAKSSKRPFGLTFNYDGITIQMSCTNRSIKWQRIIKK